MSQEPLNTVGIQAEVSDTETGRRMQGVRLKLPGGTEIEFRGLTIVMYAFFALISVNSYVLWRHEQTSDRMVTAISIQTCMMISNSTVEAQEARYMKCYQLYNDWQQGRGNK